MAESNRLPKGVKEQSGDGASTGAVALTRLQRSVARRMAVAKAEIPDFTTEVEIEMTDLLALREVLRAAPDGAPSYNDFVVRACALALRRVPKLNASFSAEGIVYHDRVNVGVAVAHAGALVVPTVFDADLKSVGEISTAIKDLAGRVRGGSIRVEDLSEGTFTVSNLGMHGVDRFTAIISPPQVGILAVGAIRGGHAAGHGGAAPAARMAVVLSADHRVVYGADAAEFLAAVRAALEDPESLLAPGEQRDAA